MVYLFLADGFEEIEALAVVDILRRASVDIETVSLTGRPDATGSHGITVLADRMFDGLYANGAQMLILPGGPGVKNLLAHTGLRALVQSAGERGALLAAICAAPSVLGAWGLLQGKKAVCFPGYEDKLTGAVYTDSPVVTDGNIITAKGAGTAHLFAFTLAGLLKGEETASKIRKAMQYDG